MYQSSEKICNDICSALFDFNILNAIPAFTLSELSTILCAAQRTIVFWNSIGKIYFPHLLRQGLSPPEPLASIRCDNLLLDNLLRSVNTTDPLLIKLYNDYFSLPAKNPDSETVFKTHVLTELVVLLILKLFATKLSRLNKSELRGAKLPFDKDLNKRLSILDGHLGKTDFYIPSMDELIEKNFEKSTTEFLERTANYLQSSFLSINCICLQNHCYQSYQKIFEQGPGLDDGDGMACLCQCHRV